VRQLLILPTTSSGRHLTKSGGTPDLTGATTVPPKTNSARGVHAVSTPALENAHEKTEPSLATARGISTAGVQRKTHGVGREWW
jgi:hypothetical protein